MRADVADVMFYAPDGTKKMGKGLTMSSDYSLFGAIESADYMVKFEYPGKGGELPSHWRVYTMDGSNWIPELDGKPNYSKAISPTDANWGTPYKTKIFVHSVNASGWAAAYMKGGSQKGISTGCPVVERHVFNAINTKMSNSNATQFLLRITR